MIYIQGNKKKIEIMEHCNVNFEGVKYTHWLRDTIIDWFKRYIHMLIPYYKMDKIEITVKHPYNKEFLYQNAVITIKYEGRTLFDDMKNIMMIKLSEDYYSSVINMKWLQDENNYILSDKDLYNYIMLSSYSEYLFKYYIPDLKRKYHYREHN